MHKFERWRSTIQVAKTRQDVMQLVRDYIACVLPSELLKMPSTSQSAVADATIDLAGAAVTLTRDELQFRGDEETAALMHEMSQTFTAASTRLSHLDYSAVEPASQAPAAAD